MASGNSVEYVYYLKDLFSRNAGAMALAAQNVSRSAKKAGIQMRHMAAIGGAVTMVAGIAVIGSLVDNYTKWDAVLTDVHKVVPSVVSDFKLIDKEIYNLATKTVPIAREQMAMFFESGIRGGVANAKKGTVQYIKELSDFAKLGSETAFMYNMSAEQSAMTLAKMKSSLNMSLPEMAAFLKQINLLGDTMATNESNILEVVRRVGANVQALAGTDKVLQARLRRDVAAAGAAMTAAGVKDEIAGTGLRNFMLRVGLGKEAVKDVRKAMKMAGLDGSKVAKQMQVDFLGSMEVVLVAINKITDIEKRNAALKNIFGLRAVDAFAPLLANIGLLKEARDLSADVARQQKRWDTGLAVKYASIQAHRQLAQTSVAFMKNAMIASYKDELVWIYDKIAQIAQFIQENPFWARLIGGMFGFMVVAGGLIMTLGLLAMSLSALGITSLAAALPMLAMVAGIAAVGYAIYQLYAHWSELSQGMKMAMGALLGLGLAMLGVSLPMLAMVALVAGVALAAYKLANSWNSLSVAARVLGAGLIVVAVGLLAVLSPILAVVVGAALLAYAAYKIYQNWDGIAAYFSNLWANIKQGMAETFTWENAKAGVKSFFAGVWEGWKNIALLIKDSILNLFSFEMPAWMKSLGNWLSGKQGTEHKLTLEEKLAASWQAKDMAQAKNDLDRWPANPQVRAGAQMAVDNYRRLKGELQAIKAAMPVSLQSPVMAGGMNPVAAANNQAAMTGAQKIQVETMVKTMNHVDITAPFSIPLTLPNGAVAGHVPLTPKVKSGTNAANSFGLGNNYKGSGG